MNRKMQKCIAWHPLGNLGIAQRDEQSAYSPIAGPVTLLTTDQLESCGFRRNARVINI